MADPLKQFENYLEQHMILTIEQMTRLKEQTQSQLQAKVAQVKQSPISHDAVSGMYFAK